MANATYERLNSTLAHLIREKHKVDVHVYDAIAAPGMVKIHYGMQLTAPMNQSSAHFWLKGFRDALEMARG